LKYPTRIIIACQNFARRRRACPTPAALGQLFKIGLNAISGIIAAAQET
jgi:hypothetical protein